MVELVLCAEDKVSIQRFARQNGETNNGIGAVTDR